ncbi:hypothetical protein [Dictyobacter kobayashii]|uniref:Uncharacterized protein n=1 Tax=Dictyobacter kobayashii TaxID=2014872 RepID=A0A402AW14_9CHLR|nr:hypothetical protein [Dictyobacter kobayashii]GCE23340.1 hypothetical protein KDK_71400 [Dictyobacter kobayashii]
MFFKQALKDSQNTAKASRFVRIGSLLAIVGLLMTLLGVLRIAGVAHADAHLLQSTKTSNFNRSRASAPSVISILITLAHLNKIVGTTIS